jgi:putative ABC transport system permease protein
VRSALRVAREAAAAAFAQPVAGLVAIIIIAGMCAAVLLTQGRTAGAQQSVVATLDDAGTRSIIVRGQGEAGLRSDVLERLDGYSSIAWSSGFGPAVDATNSVISGGARVAVRQGYGIDYSSLGASASAVEGGAFASRAALDALGMEAASGAVTTVDGIDVAIVDEIEVPDYLRFLEPLIIVPTNDDEPATMSVLVVVADTASKVEPLTGVVRSVLDLADASEASIETSADLARLRGLIDAQLAGVGQALTIGILTLTAALVAAVLTALVMLRRKEYGRRRALGASQRLIVGLVVAQTAVLSVIGAVVGSVAAFVALTVSGDPQPPPTYYLAIAILAIATGMTASVVPAVAAARRDPARELRVP